MMLKYQVNSGMLLLLAVLGLTSPGVEAGTVLGPWTPLLKGIDHAVGTNTPGGGGFATLQVVHAIRVDLTDPDIQLFATPRMSNYVANSRETGGLKVKDFLTNYKLQMAINANSFDPSGYYLPAWTPMDASGVLISRGTVVSTQAGSGHAAAVMFTTNNQATIIPTNWPARSTTGIYTAVSGEYDVLDAGVNVGLKYRGNSGVMHQLQPRTAFGLSQDRRTLYLLTIDGRQPGYSEGALDWETAAWMILLGAYDAVNLDGGGSTTLVVADSMGKPVELNHSSAVADSGKERTVGAHFGIYAKPLPAFINEVTATNPIFDVTNAWKYTAQNLDNVPWITPKYDDSSWSDPGLGLLWIDVRSPPDADVQPKNTELPASAANNGYPYITYYFRTHFNFTNQIARASLGFSCYLDDGAIFYLNGIEIYRLNMPDAPTPVQNNTLATGYSGTGDAAAPVDFTVSGDPVTNLVAGDNVLAVEVHNYNRMSPDITFGTSLLVTEPYTLEPQLTITVSGGTATITWSRLGFSLQQADAPTGSWTGVPGPIVSSPFIAVFAGSARYYRLSR